MNQTEVGKLVSTKGGGDPVNQTTVSGWLSENIPTLYDIYRLAKALDVDPGWLAFGNSSQAPGPDDPVRERSESRPKWEE